MVFNIVANGFLSVLALPAGMPLASQSLLNLTDLNLTYIIQYDRLANPTSGGTRAVRPVLLNRKDVLFFASVTL